MSEKRQPYMVASDWHAQDDVEAVITAMEACIRTLDTAVAQLRLLWVMEQAAALDAEDLVALHRVGRGKDGAEG